MRGLLLTAGAAFLALGCGGVDMALPSPELARHTVYLNFADGQEGVSQGERDDASSNVSELCSTAAFAAWPGAADCDERGACAGIVRELVADHFTEYDVSFTLERPAGTTPYSMVMIAPSNADCSFGRLGVAATDCGNANPSSVAFVFDCQSSAVQCALVVAHEVAHTFGLVHVVSDRDLMTLSPHASAGESSLEFHDASWTATPNECGVREQNSRHVLLRALGPRR